MLSSWYALQHPTTPPRGKRQNVRPTQPPTQPQPARVQSCLLPVTGANYKLALAFASCRRATFGRTAARCLPAGSFTAALEPPAPPPPPHPSLPRPPQATSLQPSLSTTFMLNPTELTRYRRSSCRKHVSMRSLASSRDMPSRKPLSRRLRANREARPCAPKATFWSAPRASSQNSSG